MRFQTGCVIFLAIFYCSSTVAGPPCEQCNRITDRNPAGGYICRYCNPDQLYRESDDSEPPPDERPCYSEAVQDQEVSIDCCVCFDTLSGHCPDEKTTAVNEKNIYLYCCESNICEACLSGWIQQNNSCCPRCKLQLHFGETCRIPDCSNIVHPECTTHLFKKHLVIFPVIDPYSEEWNCPVCRTKYSDVTSFHDCYIQHQTRLCSRQ